MKSQSRRYFAGKPQKPEENTTDDSSSDSERAAKTHIRQTAKSTTHPLHSGNPRSSALIEAKVAPAAGTSLNAPTTKTRRRRRIEAKVLNADGDGKRDSTELFNADGRPPCNARDSVNDEREGSKLSKFKLFDESEKDSEEEKLPELNVAMNESSCSSSAEDSSSDSDNSQTSGPSNELQTESPRDCADGGSWRPQALEYVPNAARIDAERQAIAIKVKRTSEKNERARAVREETLLAARQTIEETEHDLKHVDMSQFPDDTDRQEDFEEEYTLWRVRELKRCLRERGVDIDCEADDPRPEEAVGVKPRTD